MKKPGFIAGFQYFLKGFSLIRTPGIRRYAVIPLLINAILFIGALWFGISYIGGLIESMQPEVNADSAFYMRWLGTLMAWAGWVLIPLFVLIFMAVTFYSFTLIANLIGAPFNSLLAEKIEDHLAGVSTVSSSNMLSMIKDIGGSFASEFRKLLYFALRAIPLLILFFIPGINVIAGLFWFLFSAWMLSIEYSDYPMGNHAIRFPHQRLTLKGNRMFALGYGTGVTIATMIPIVNFVVMPAAVAGATAMWVDHWKDNIPQIEVK